MSILGDIEAKGPPVEPGTRYVTRIEAHLGRLAHGHDPLGHLFAIERLARAERSERWAAQRAEHGSSRR